MHLESKQIRSVNMIIKHTFIGFLTEKETAARLRLMRAVAYNGKRAACLPDLALNIFLRQKVKNPGPCLMGIPKQTSDTKHV